MQLHQQHSAYAKYRLQVCVTRHRAVRAQFLWKELLLQDENVGISYADCSPGLKQQLLSQAWLTPPSTAGVRYYSARSETLMPHEILESHWNNTLPIQILCWNNKNWKQTLKAVTLILWVRLKNNKRKFRVQNSGTVLFWGSQTQATHRSETVTHRCVPVAIPRRWIMPPTCQSSHLAAPFNTVLHGEPFRVYWSICFQIRHQGFHQ